MADKEITETFILEWKINAKDLVSKFKDCETEEELLRLIQDNMQITLPKRRKQ